MFKKVDYFFLIAAYLSFMMSIALWFLKDQQAGMYVGIWVPSILILWVGMKQIIYNRKKWDVICIIYVRRCYYGYCRPRHNWSRRIWWLVGVNVFLHWSYYLRLLLKRSNRDQRTFITDAPSGDSFYLEFGKGIQKAVVFGEKRYWGLDDDGILESAWDPENFRHLPISSGILAVPWPPAKSLKRFKRTNTYSLFFKIRIMKFPTFSTLRWTRTQIKIGHLLNGLRAVKK